jgi:hypothetical protein
MRHFETIIKLLLALMLTLMFFASAMNYRTGDSLYIVVSIICVILSYGIFLSKNQHK